MAVDPEPSHDAGPEEVAGGRPLSAEVLELIEEQRKRKRPPPEPVKVSTDPFYSSDEFRDAVREMVERQTREQGLPFTIEDPIVIGRLSRALDRSPGVSPLGGVGGASAASRKE